MDSNAILQYADMQKSRIVDQSIRLLAAWTAGDVHH